jgi:elongation factor Ts
LPSWRKRQHPSPGRVEGDVVGAYLHGNKIGVAVVLKGGDVELAKDIAMHVAASNPEFLLPSQVSLKPSSAKKLCSCS